MNLKESNRWVKKAQMIPWLKIEKRYAALFTNRKGNVAKPLRLALGACIIQAEYTDVSVSFFLSAEKLSHQDCLMENFGSSNFGVGCSSTFLNFAV